VTALGVIATVVAATALGGGAMLLLRRRAPAGGYFEDTQQVAGVFAVAGTTFAVLLAFVFLFAFEQYNDARDQAELEATATTGLFDLGPFFEPPSDQDLQGDLVCYARAVVREEWPAMADGHSSPIVQARVDELQRGITRASIETPRSQWALGGWFEQNSQRQLGRRGRLLEARPLVPPMVWYLLLIGAVVVIAFVFFFADRRERRISQIWLVVAMTLLVVSGLAVVSFLDHPYEDEPGSIRPVAMEETLGHIEARYRATWEGAPPPCDARGR
jgi:hypothetical protein